MSLLRREKTLKIHNCTFFRSSSTIIGPNRVHQLTVRQHANSINAKPSQGITSNKVRFSKFPILQNETKIDNDITPEDKEDLKRKINLNRLLDKLKEHVPDILDHSLPKSLISKNIYLRICPSQLDETYLPKLNGPLTYYTSCKAIQLFLTSVMLSPKVKLHIQSIRVSQGPEPQCMFADTTKVFMRWSTCLNGCPHLEEQGTSQANLGSHKWSAEDTKKIFDNHKTLSSVVKKLPTTIMGLTKESKKLERVLTGLFIFELDEDNSKILVHTIENMEVIEKFEPSEEDADVLPAV
ncbi:hypothetical protein SBY92_003453 [Candida maltosa Xu316]|uniref:Uncharacterized protein n=1 Tax=Candida maltosa (strain Xu316) TaxID=1245528 RepID=M3J1K7_CANMX|nr:hypothetical protein G210_4043 [Candida maltosa Xu316]